MHIKLFIERQYTIIERYKRLGGELTYIQPAMVEELRTLQWCHHPMIL